MTGLTCECVEYVMQQILSLKSFMSVCCLQKYFPVIRGLMELSVDHILCDWALSCSTAATLQRFSVCTNKQVTLEVVVSLQRVSLRQLCCMEMQRISDVPSCRASSNAPEHGWNATGLLAPILCGMNHHGWKAEQLLLLISGIGWLFVGIEKCFTID